MSDVLVFVTGAADIPHLDLKNAPLYYLRVLLKPQVTYVPSASTCFNTLYLPMVHCNDYGTFKNM